MTLERLDKKTAVLNDVKRREKPGFLLEVSTNFPILTIHNRVVYTRENKLTPATAYTRRKYPIYLSILGTFALIL